MYMMPQAGTRVSLYFKGDEEESALAVNCIRSGAGCREADLLDVTGDEFNMFTNGSRRLIIRGSGREIKVTKKMHNGLITGVYGKFSVHTHPPGYSIEPGPRDGAFLLDLGQRRSAIWGTGVDKYGQKRNGGFLFGVDDMETDEIRREAEREIMRKLYENN